jgi:hypothetical protein
MSLDFVKYTNEIIEFKNAETLEAIDWGVLDLGHIRDLELKDVLLKIEEELTLELRRNYEVNSTGIFRVSHGNGIWSYREFKCVIRADSLPQLKDKVISQNRIWYVFDEFCVRY